MIDRVVAVGTSAVAILCLALSVSQCSGRVKAERALVKAERQSAATAADLKTCRASRVTLKTSIDAQNAAVEALKAEGAAKVAESAKAARSARAVAESLRQEAGRVLQSKPGADVCNSADALIMEVAG